MRNSVSSSLTSDLYAESEMKSVVPVTTQTCANIKDRNAIKYTVYKRLVI